MNNSGSIISLDVGERRIGVAMASVDARIAQPLLTLDRQDGGDIFERLQSIFDEHHTTAVVVGLPRGMEGQETHQTIVARQFAEDLAKSSGLPIHLQDEAATSLVAEEELQASRKPYVKGDIDKLAAAIILRDWLQLNQNKD